VPPSATAAMSRNVANQTLADGSALICVGDSETDSPISSVLGTENTWITRWRDGASLRVVATLTAASIGAAK
jgi:hypothetical protein